MSYKRSRNVYIVGKPTISTEELANIFSMSFDEVMLRVRHLINNQTLDITSSTYLVLPYMHVREKVKISFINGMPVKVQEEYKQYGYSMCINTSLIIINEIDKIYQNLGKESYFENLILEGFNLGKLGHRTWWNKAMSTNERWVKFCPIVEYSLNGEG